jgi:hypothetical protein
METTPALDAALAGEHCLFFVCGKVELPGYTLRLLDGASQITFSEGTFVGKDDTFGSIAAFGSPGDGQADQAPELNVTLSPPNDTAAVTLSTPQMQGSRVRVWLGAIDLATRLVVADPYLLFDGVLDQPILEIDNNQRTLEYECVSAFERLFREDEGIRLSDTNQQEVWPGELGLQFMTGITKQVLWGPGELISSGFSTSGGGGGAGLFNDGMSRVF